MNFKDCFLPALGWWYLGLAALVGTFTLASTFGVSLAASAQEAASTSAPQQPVVLPLSPVRQAMSRNPFEWGPFFNGGVGVGHNRNGYHFLSVGVHAGKVLTDPIGPGFLKGQFEYAADLMPWWQGYAPPYQRYNDVQTGPRTLAFTGGPYPTGGAYNGVSITPIILRWNLTGGKRFLPFAQGAGGLIWTNHKFPPVGPIPVPGHQGTSVWNFTPQFGIGVHYFLRPNRSLTLQANAVHISNASLGDSNPGVNASVQFQIGYTWWK